MTLSNPSPTILMVPGLRDHVAEHWQTLLEAKLRAAGHKAASVQPLEVDRLSCEARVAALDKAVSTIDGGDTLAAEVSGPDGGTVFLLIPLGAAGALITQLTDAAERGAQERRLHSRGRLPTVEV